MRCDQAEREISAALDGAAADPGALDEHLTTCERCRGYEADLRRLRTALRFDARLTPPDLTEAVVARLEGRAMPNMATRWRRRVATAVVAAFAAGLVGGAAVTVIGDERARIATAAAVEEELDRAQLEVAPYRSSFELLEVLPNGTSVLSTGTIVYAGPERMAVTRRAPEGDYARCWVMTRCGSASRGEHPRHRGGADGGAAAVTPRAGDARRRC